MKWIIGLILLLGLAGPSLAEAPPPSLPGPGAQWEAADLKPMTGMGESYQSTTLVTVAYSFIWIMVLGFVASVWWRSGQVARELEDLKRQIARRSAPPSSAPPEKV